MRPVEYPFERIEGNSQQVAIHNRISALARIEHLTDVDLSKKNMDYKALIDAELYSRWYKDYPASYAIDEEWCQRVALVIKELEAKNPVDLDILEQGAVDTVIRLYSESKAHPSIPEEIPIEEIKEEVELEPNFDISNHIIAPFVDYTIEPEISILEEKPKKKRKPRKKIEKIVEQKIEDVVETLKCSPPSLPDSYITEQEFEYRKPSFLKRTLNWISSKL